MNTVIQVSRVFSVIMPRKGKCSKDICVYLIYVAMVLIVSHGNRDMNSFYMKVCADHDKNYVWFMSSSFNK